MALGFSVVAWALLPEKCSRNESLGCVSNQLLGHTLLPEECLEIRAEEAPILLTIFDFRIEPLSEVHTSFFKLSTSRFGEANHVVFLEAFDWNLILEHKSCLLNFLAKDFQGSTNVAVQPFLTLFRNTFGVSMKVNDH